MSCSCVGGLAARTAALPCLPNEFQLGERAQKHCESSSPPMGTHQGITSCWKMYSAKAFSSGVSSVR